MEKADRIGRIVNWIVFTYLVAITLLTWIGKIAYGHGLGDLIFFFESLAFAVVHLIVLITLIYKRGETAEKGTALLVSLIFLLIAVAFTYKFTLGRGVEYKWNGNVFYGKNETKVEVQALTPPTPITGPPHRRADA